jgi:hypothetical protein
LIEGCDHCAYSEAALALSLSFLGRMEDDQPDATAIVRFCPEPEGFGFTRCPRSMSSGAEGAVLVPTDVDDRLRLTVGATGTTQRVNGSLRDPEPFRDGDRDLLR